jgi:hypothetical protein
MSRLGEWLELAGVALGDAPRMLRSDCDAGVELRACEIIEWRDPDTDLSAPTWLVVLGPLGDAAIYRLRASKLDRRYVKTAGPAVRTAVERRMLPDLDDTAAWRKLAQLDQAAKPPRVRLAKANPTKPRTKP